MVLSEKLSRAERAVIPGFYGSMPDGTIRLFSRGGSDITGAIAADAMDADIYENFTDVPGFLLADPRVVPDAQTVPVVSYRELRYLSAMGAQVLHADAILPLRKKQIPIVIRNTNEPHGAHTWIVARKEKGIGGIVSAVGYTMIALERAHIGDDFETATEVLSILSAYGFVPTIFSREPDAMNILIRYCDYEKADKIALAIQQKTGAEIVTVRGGLAEIAIAGEGFTSELRGVVWRALEKANIRPCFAASLTESFSLVIGVSEVELSQAVHHIYEGLVPFLHQ
jgi:aspartate kinase